VPKPLCSVAHFLGSTGPIGEVRGQGMPILLCRYLFRSAHVARRRCRLKRATRIAVSPCSKMRCDHRPPLSSCEDMRRCGGAPTTTECNRNAPNRAHVHRFRTRSLRLLRIRGPVFRDGSQAADSMTSDSGRRHHPLSSGPLSFTRSPFLRAARRSIIAAEKHTIGLQHLARADVDETGHQSLQHETQRVHQVESLLNQHSPVIKGLERQL
ncbi:hypothetical protein MAAFP003_5409, partial [Mycobacterium ahvazicum]